MSLCGAWLVGQKNPSINGTQCPAMYIHISSVKALKNVSKHTKTRSNMASWSYASHAGYRAETNILAAAYVLEQVVSHELSHVEILRFCSCRWEMLQIHTKADSDRTKKNF